MDKKLWVVTVRVKQYQYEDKFVSASSMEQAKDKVEAAGFYVTGVSTYDFED